MTADITLPCTTGITAPVQLLNIHEIISCDDHLKMFVFFILGNDVTRDKMKLDVKCVLGDLIVFKLLHFVGLFQPALQDATHALDSTLS